MGQRTLIWTKISVVVALALAALVGCAPSGSTSSSLPTSYFRATDISMDSPTDGWAAGSWITPRPSPSGASSNSSLAAHENATTVPALAHFHDGVWQIAPASVTGALDAFQTYHLVRMLSPTDGWAATGYQLYHFDGVRWRLTFPLANAPMGSIAIEDVRFFSHDIGWAVGESGILQYAHGAWTNVTNSLPPRPKSWLPTWNYPGLHSVAIVSARDAWATGDGGTIWRYDGVQWRIAASPYFPNRFYTSPSVDGYTASAALLAHFDLNAHTSEALYAAQLLSSSQGWSVGGPNPNSFVPGQSQGPTVVERYHAGVWQVIYTLSGHLNDAHGQPALFCLAMTSDQDGWIGGAWVHVARVGSGDAGPVAGPEAFAPLLLHYQAGQWAIVLAPPVGAIHHIVMLSPDEGWAAADGGLLHYSGGQWRLVSVSPSA